MYSADPTQLEIRSALSKYFGIHVPAVSALGSKKRSATARDLTTVALEETIHGGSADYHVFRHPYILIEDIHEIYRPVFKEYDPNAVEQPDSKPAPAAAPSAPATNVNAIPYLFLGSLPGHCPFYNPPCDSKKSQKVSSRIRHYVHNIHLMRS